MQERLLPLRFLWQVKQVLSVVGWLVVIVVVVELFGEVVNWDDVS